MTARILAFAGSIRRDSINRRLAQAAARGAEAAGAEVTWLELADWPLPIYDGDLEADSGFPENVIALKDMFDAHDGLLIGCPEYNSSITPLLKNTIDWISRPIEVCRRRSRLPGQGRRSGGRVRRRAGRPARAGACA